MRKVYAISLGCPKNRVDTERALGSLGPVRMVEHLGRADLIFINTCGFILPAVEESVRTVLEAIAHRAGLRRRPVLAVAGCLVGRYGAKDLAKDLPEVDVWLDNRALEDWPALLASALRRNPAAPARLLSTGPSYAWLKISDGCRHACAFCTIPAIRGAQRSSPLEELAQEAQGLLEQGVRELVLVAQDLTDWGRDLRKRRNLVSLLEWLLRLEGLVWLRLLYLYPAGITPRFLDFMRETAQTLLPYFDIPLQHAHPEILAKMGRPFARDPRRVVDAVRAKLPDAALRTSLIAGFPGETDRHFASLRAFVREARFDHLGVFSYRAEEGTPAAAMPGQVPEEIREERRADLMRLQAEISAEKLEALAGRRMQVLVDAVHPEWPGLHTGRVWMQAPEIDGVTYVSGPGVRPGVLVDAEIVETRDYDLNALA
ncbi:MAG: 30S ribosomal protein S12 methylthiotransferase RimO [Deltaproteobacteria bacterium]|jgi:tRNA-2-methylthio-N6-dimethylallyladenosine synthase/ribosomal protein S12 methylthiotransferase|nr:30S ribosomal protein S12 methylthiotransferase RimO [Deltaproteobacteria bacterium]